MLCRPVHWWYFIGIVKVIPDDRLPAVTTDWPPGDDALKPPRHEPCGASAISGRFVCPPSRFAVQTISRSPLRIHINSSMTRPPSISTLPRARRASRRETSDQSSCLRVTRPSRYRLPSPHRSRAADFAHLPQLEFCVSM